MTLVVGEIVLDARDPKALARFWPEATRFPVGSASDEFARLTSDDPGGKFYFLKVPEGKTAKNRLHIDFKVSGDREAPGARRERCGETRDGRWVQVGRDAGPGR